MPRLRPEQFDAHRRHAEALRREAIRTFRLNLGALLHEAKAVAHRLSVALDARLHRKIDRPTHC